MKHNSTHDLMEEFITLAETKINRPGIDQLLEYLESTNFFVAPASRNYHGNYPGGLVEHSLNVYYNLLSICNHLRNTNDLIKFREESIAIVALFHDLCKADMYKMSSKKERNAAGIPVDVPCYVYNKNYRSMGHATESLYILQKFMDLSREEWEAIYWHMGGFDLSNYSNNDRMSAAYRNNTLAFALHQADMMSAYVTENEDGIQAQYDAKYGPNSPDII